MSDAEKDIVEPFPVGQDRWYAVTDSDWTWDSTDDGDGAPFITLATSPDQAAKKAARQWATENGGCWGVHMKVARLDLAGFMGCEVGNTGAISFDEFQPFVNDDVDTITTLRAEVGRLTDENLENANGWNTSLGLAEFWTECVKIEEARANKAEAERDAAIARAEKLEAALTPSLETKAALMGEFSMQFPELDEDGEECMRTINVPWTTIKEIMAAIRALASLTEGE